MRYSFKIGGLRVFLLEYQFELHVTSKNGFARLNRAGVRWYPDMSRDRANTGWIWFDSYQEYRKAKTILRKREE